MAYSVNTTPLLQEYDSENEYEPQISPEIEVDTERPLFKLPEPKDKYHMAFIIYYLLGIVTLLPWNFYVTADDYWMYKFRNVSESVNLVAPQKRTQLQAEFTSYLSVASALPNLIFLILNTAISHRVTLNKRVLGSLFFMQLLMLVTLAFVNINTDKWQQTFFGITLTSIVILNVCSAIFSGSIFGAVGKFSPIYITAVIGGQALGGIFAAVAQIVALSVGASSTHAALVYFIIGNVTVATSIVCYVVLEKTVFFKYHVVETRINELHDESSTYAISYKIILRKMWCQGLSVMITFLITLAVYPGMTVLIESEGKGHGNQWNGYRVRTWRILLPFEDLAEIKSIRMTLKAVLLRLGMPELSVTTLYIYFVPTIAYLLFSVGDYLGRIVAGKLLRPKNVTILLILTISRFIFIPLLLLCNAQPRHHLAVVFDKDYQYILILFLFALSNGYIANLTQIFVTKVVDHHEKELASSIMTVFMGVGLTLGSVICLFIVKVI